MNDFIPGRSGMADSKSENRSDSSPLQHKIFKFAVSMLRRFAD